MGVDKKIGKLLWETRSFKWVTGGSGPDGTMTGDTGGIDGTPESSGNVSRRRLGDVDGKRK